MKNLILNKRNNMNKIAKKFLVRNVYRLIGKINNLLKKSIINNAINKYFIKILFFIYFK